MAGLNAVRQKVSGKSTGETGTKMTKGYAATSPDKIVIGTKVGVIGKRGYSGPNVAQKSRGDA